MLPDNREELMKYRLEMAEERLKFSKILLDAGSYKDSIGRSYYAMFTAVRALLAIDGQDFRNNTDYADFFIVSVQDAQEQYERAKEFFEMIKTYLQNNERVQNHLLFIHMGVLLWQKSVQAITCATVITKFLLSVINMRDGILMGHGKGNSDWNESAPHGAGRLMKRETVKESYHDFPLLPFGFPQASG